ncbi:hypothetical protein DVDV_0437 [Desulfovibrio sp. DV]|uniref:hypothetical protein n=1 Tax=Desulfovibrio sp. DV TaxID=1844708 RepID=UPI00094BBECF|nr:hypothetical protein [Desulfovibrio sp. DV]OLN30735.1 hypothetical protein DVDV_0437 [Desulfovibrio sp. DV]
MKRQYKWIVGMVLGIAASGMFSAASAAPITGTVLAGFTGLPLRNCQGTYCGELAKLPFRQPLNILVNDREGWAYVDVAGTGQRGWVCLDNTTQ